MYEIDNFATSSAVLRRKGHTLLCYILSKYDFDMLKNPIDEYWCPIIEMQEYEHEQLHDYLLSFSALMRVNDDISNGFKKHKEANPEGVGFITQNGEKKSLSLREACNKIIHCTKYEWNLAYSNEHPLYPDYDNVCYEIEHWQKYKNPILELEGEYHGGSWNVQVFLLKYILAFSWGAQW